MPCHLIVAHSNSWSSDTDKWTCVITLDFFVTFHSVKTASAQHVTKKQTRAIAVSSINLSLFLSVLCLYNHSPTAAWQWMEELRVWGREDGWWSEGDRWTSALSLLLCKHLFALREQAGRGKQLLFYFPRLLHMEKEKSGKGGLSLKSSRVYHFLFYLFNLFIVSNH